MSLFIFSLCILLNIKFDIWLVVNIIARLRRSGRFRATEESGCESVIQQRIHDSEEGWWLNRQAGAAPSLGVLRGWWWNSFIVNILKCVFGASDRLTLLLLSLCCSSLLCSACSPRVPYGGKWSTRVQALVIEMLCVRSLMLERIEELFFLHFSFLYSQYIFYSMDPFPLFIPLMI